MGCTASNLRSRSKETVETVKVDHDQETYLSLKRRFGLPNQHKKDGYDFGLCVRDNAGGIYSSYIGTSRETNEKISIKQFNLQQYEPNLIVQEVANLARLSHEAFPRVIELFHTDTSIYMITTYTDIFRLKNAVDLRNRTTSFTVPEVRKIFKTLVSAVLHCHDQQLLLRSLLPENIMVIKQSDHPAKGAGKDSTSGFDVKICDLGLAMKVTKAEGSVYSEHPLFDWTHVPFLAPEVASKQSYTFPCDIWSLGVILYMMLCARLPFFVEDAMDRAVLLQKIRSADFAFHPEDQVWSADRMDNVQGLIRGMLTPDPLNRATISEIRRNPWMSQQ